MRELYEPPIDAAHPELEKLAPKARAIALCLAGEEGSLKEIAPKFGIALGTLQKHTENIYRKLKVHSRDDLRRLLKS